MTAHNMLVDAIWGIEFRALMHHDLVTADMQTALSPDASHATSQSFIGAGCYTVYKAWSYRFTRQRSAPIRLHRSHSIFLRYLQSW